LTFSLLIAKQLAALASSRRNCIAFVPEGLHLDRSFTANNPG
jgi:hypothetical protein